jgi:uncharacterized membrane protein
MTKNFFWRLIAYIVFALCFVVFTILLILNPHDLTIALVVVNSINMLVQTISLMQEYKRMKYHAPDIVGKGDKKEDNVDAS